jgi:magnesium transporter
MAILPRIKTPRRDTRDVVVAPAPEKPRLEELHASGLTWVHLDAPTKEEVEALATRFGWHPLDVEDVLSKRQRPKVDDYVDEGYLFSVLHFPVYDKSIGRLNAAELDIFLGPDYLVTLPNVELLPVTRLFRRCTEDAALRDELFAKGSGRLLYEVLDDLFDYCFPILDKIGHKLDVIEDVMFEGKAEEVVRDISNVKQEIISYRKIIKPERSTLRLLERHVERDLRGGHAQRDAGAHEQVGALLLERGAHAHLGLHLGQAREHRLDVAGADRRALREDRAEQAACRGDLHVEVREHRGRQLGVHSLLLRRGDHERSLIER